MRFSHLALLTTSILLSTSALAEQQEETAERQQYRSSTERLLALQREGDQSSNQPQTQSAEVRTRVLKRYEKSFDHPIPSSYIDTSFSSK
ncbi:MAG: DUF3613 domain-containing protein [Spongiibacteraceae bacterium]